MNIEEFASLEEINIWLQEYKKTKDNKIKIQLRNLIALAYLPFIKKISYSLARRSSDPVEDLIQVGSLGLLKAIELFNINIGTRFKTYATYLITGEIKHYLRDKGAMIKAPRELQELAFRINQIIQKLTKKLGRIPTNFEIAEELQIPINRVTEVINIDRRKQTISLDQIISSNNENTQTLIEKIIDSKYQDYLRMQEDRIMLIEAIELLNEPLRKIIELSFFEDMNQNEISKHLGISQMQVSRRIKKAISELFKIITKKKIIIECNE
ncbi:MAG: sigma-70 family RNA polymerase sigma factor [bacterium]